MTSSGRDQAEGERQWPRRCVRCEHLIYPLGWMLAFSYSHAARGLCQPCWHKAKASDELIDFERLNRTRDEVMADWELLRSEGYSKRQAAARLGMSHEAFDRAFHRARRAGDPRAVTHSEQRRERAS